MSEWRIATLGAVANLQNGYAFKPAQLTGRGAPVVRIRQLLDASAEVDYSDVQVPEQFWIEDGDLIFSWSGTLAAAVWGRGPAILNQHLFKVTSADQAVDLRWLHLVLDHAIDDLNTKTHGTTMKHITKKVLEAQAVPVPPRAEQRRIIDLIGGIDVHIGALSEELQSARALYRNASSRLWLDVDEMEAPARALGDVMALDIDRITLEPDETYSSAGVLGAGQGLINKGTFRGADTGYAVMNRLRVDQVVMRKLTAWEGPITIVPVAFDGFVASNEFPTFSLTSEVRAGWMRHVCRTERLWEEMKNRVTGSVQRRKRLNPEQLMTVSLPVPSRDAQDLAAAALDEVDALVGALEVELSTTRTLRRALLTALLRQDLNIPDSYDSLLEKAVV